MPEVGIAIVTYQSAAVIGGCLEACAAYAPGCPVVVVDNASKDETQAAVGRHPHAQLIANRENAGFAAAVNQAVAVLDTPLVLILNPDCRLRTGLAPLAAEFADPAVSAAGGSLWNSDGTPQHGFHVRRFPTAASLAFEILGVNRLWPGNPVNRRYRESIPLTAADVDQPAGAFLMVRKTAWEQIGGLDESFHPVWFEDVDFCLRLRRAGYRIRFQPRAEAAHQGGHSIKPLEAGQRDLYWYQSLLRYAARHFSPAERRFVAAALLIAGPFRLILRCFPYRNHHVMFVYSKLFRSALRCWTGAHEGVASRTPPRLGEPNRPGPAVLFSGTTNSDQESPHGS